MPVKLARIDDRLIHGQVVLGWVPVVKPNRIVVACDRVAASDWERKFYASCVPPDIPTSFFSIEETARSIETEPFNHEQLLILLESAQDAWKLVNAGVALKEVNVGGLHYREGAIELLPFVFVTPEDRASLRELVKKGVTLSAQDVPSNPARIINSLVV
ncbi:MAG TPA: PTS sugar transporter subunit IIB [Candidatus Krumholzibacteria bacterium]|nr:PTS sugar transporter subunit IIB [Candidatus Krumholzibacteria bacterium]